MIVCFPESQCKDNTCRKPNVPQCPTMSCNVPICPDKGEKECRLFGLVVDISYICIVIENHKIPKYMFQIRPYGKAELALLYQPCSSPETAQKTFYRWIKGCPLLMQELDAMHYNPKRRTFLKPEVEAIIKHLGEP